MPPSHLEEKPNLLSCLERLSRSFLFPVFFYTVFFVLFFSPTLIAGRLLAPNDGLNYNLPNFYAATTLWTNLLFSGFPVAADPQAQTWYPLSLLFSLIPNSWNAYMISAYVLSACFMFGYVRTVTQSRMAGLLAGIGYSMSGFMIGRMGQVPLVHAAIWLPLLFWALEKNRQQPSVGWTAIGSLAIACSFLGGHPQIIFFGLMVAGAYVVYLGWYPVERRWSYFRRFALMVILGIGLVGIQILPTIELAEWSARVNLSYSEFVRYSLSPSEVVTLLFPYVYGGGGTLYDVKYYGGSNGLEMSGYLGLLTLMLAGLAVVGSRSNRVVRFWLATFLIGFLLALGEHTGLSQLMFYLPGFNKFRAPLRHFLEISLAVSVLAGLGADCLQRKKINPQQIKGLLGGAVGIFGLGLALIWIFSGALEQSAFSRGVEPSHIISWRNPALWMPVGIITLGVCSLFFWWKSPGAPGRKLLILIVLVVDLGSFGWFHDWRNYVPLQQRLQPPESAHRYQQLLKASHQRLAPVEGIHGDREQFPVNLSRLWNLPSVSGYNPLVLSRVNEL